MNNNVDKKSVTDLSSGVVDRLMRSLENLLETQMTSMQIRDEGKRRMARQHLIAAYVDVASPSSARTGKGRGRVGLCRRSDKGVLRDASQAVALGRMTHT